MILWNLGSWYDVANCCNNCFGYGMNSSTVSDCNWLRATTGCYYVQGYGSKKAKAVPCAASTRFVIFCMIFQCWNTCASCIPLVYFSLCSRSSHCMGGLALHSRFFFWYLFRSFSTCSCAGVSFCVSKRRDCWTLGSFQREQLCNDLRYEVTKSLWQCALVAQIISIFKFTHLARVYFLLLFGVGFGDDVIYEYLIFTLT